MNLEILNLSLKNSPNSDFFHLNLSLENSPNSTLEFEDFEKNMSLEILHLSLENSPNSVFFFK